MIWAVGLARRCCRRFDPRSRSFSLSSKKVWKKLHVTELITFLGMNISDTGLDERPLQEGSLLRSVLERRADGLCSRGYRLVITSRPCNTVYDLLRQPGIARHIYHLTGFSHETREKFMRSYVERRHKTPWHAVKQRMDDLLEPASSFIEPLTRLPLVVTLVAELLPTMDLKEVPKTRSELFNTLLVRGLLRRDLPSMEAEVVTNDIRQLPPERQEALLILSDLALDGLLQKPPKLVFRYADIVAKCKGNSATTAKEMMEVVKSVMVSYCEMDEMQEEVTSYHFVHLSFQEFFAAMALKYPTSVSAEMYGVSRLAYSAEMLTIGQRFDNFWLFAAGFFKREPEVFFKTLFSTVSINAMRFAETRPRIDIQDMLFQMLQEMIPEVNNSIKEKHSVALEQVAVFLERKISNVHDFIAIDLFRFEEYLYRSIKLTAAYFHAVQLLPGLSTVELDHYGSDYLDFRPAVLQALQSKHQLQALLLAPDYRSPLLDDEMNSLMSILQTSSLKRLQLPKFVFSAEQLKTLAGELSRMNHSLKHFWLSVDGNGEGDDALAMQSLSSALSKHHSSLIDLMIIHQWVDSEITMKLLASLLVNLKKLQHFGVWTCPESPGAFELLRSAVQASTSLTALTVVDVICHWSSPLKCSSGRLKEGEAQRQQLLHLAIHHPSITRFETSDYDSSLDDDDLMNIVTEVLKTKGKPHQLTQLDLRRCTSISEEGVDRIRELIQREELNFTIAIKFKYFNGTFQYGGGIVEELPPWLPLEK